jgi:hypothetical protein
MVDVKGACKVFCEVVKSVVIRTPRLPYGNVVVTPSSDWNRFGMLLETTSKHQSHVECCT